MIHDSKQSSIKSFFKGRVNEEKIGFISSIYALMSAGAPIHARLCYTAFSPQLVQVRMNRRACRHKSKKCWI